MKARFIALLVTLLVGGVLAQPKTEPDYSSLDIVPGTPGGTLTLPLDDSPSTFFYYGEINSNVAVLAQQMFDSLVEFNLDTYELEPGLAESWDISEDGTVYTFNLRDGVTWSDGEPFTADDVVFTYDPNHHQPRGQVGRRGELYLQRGRRRPDGHLRESR